MITITATPDPISAAWRPIIFEFESDRLALTQYNITSVSSGTGGYARYAIASPSIYVGDTVMGTAFTGLGVAYNVFQTVTVINASWFETDNLFVATATSSGILTRVNGNFQIKAETHVFQARRTAITGVANGGTGLLHIQYSGGSPSYVVGSVMLIIGTANYGGAYNVIAVSDYYITVAGTYVSSQTGVSKAGIMTGVKRLLPMLNSTTYQMNASGHVASALTIDLIDSAPATLQNGSESIKDYVVRLVEEFDDKDNLLQEHDIKFSFNYLGTRAVWQHTSDQTLAAYYNAGTGKKFLTNAPLIKAIRIGEEEQLSILSDGVVNERITIQKYDRGGAALSLVNLTLTDSIDGKFIIPINSNMFDSTISRFVVWLTNSVGTQKSEKRTFIVDYNYYQNPVRIHFENSLGGFDAYTLTGGFLKLSKTKRTTFSKNLSVGFSVRDRGNTNIASFSDQQFEVYSQLLSNAEASWLFELTNTVNVFTKAVGTTVFLPINISGESQMIYDSTQPVQLKIVYSESNQILGLSN